MLTRPATLSAHEARRIALAAQGFRPTPRLRARRPFDAALAHLHVLQIDSVNVFARSHHLPVFSRHGAYAPDMLDAHLWESGEFTEYWAHEAAFIPVKDRPLFAWRMDEFRERHTRSGRVDALATRAAAIRAQLRAEGPRMARELGTESHRGRSGWWDWSDTKHAVEMLFAHGEVVTAGRKGFQRRYALADQVIPGEHLGAVAKREAQLMLVERAARALGVATLHDLADYHRLRVTEARAATRDLEAAGTLVPVTVEGWTSRSGAPSPAWMHREARLPRALAPDAILTPFDPLVWFRPRAERLFNFHYRLEIYTPKEHRQYGYYSLPLLVGGKLAGRMDLKADRSRRVLRVQSAWQEPGAPARTRETAVHLLAQAAAWQGLTEVRTTGVGNLALPGPFPAAPSAGG